MSQPRPSLDIHRLRIGDWHPHPIKSLAVSPFNAESKETQPCYVAVGRTDGEIELLSVKENFGLVMRITGAKDFQLQGLAWAQCPEDNAQAPPQRLFGISLRGFVFEVDCAAQCLKNVGDSYGGAAWCLAACPRSATIAVGGEDGAIRLFAYTANGALRYLRALPTAGSRVLCLAFQPGLARLYAGCADGGIRCLDEDAGRLLFRTSGATHSGYLSPPLLTSLCLLGDGTAVAGDSGGQVYFFDDLGIWQSGFHTHGNNEVLSIVAGEGEDCVFIAGGEGKVVCLQRGSGREGGRERGREKERGMEERGDRAAEEEEGERGWTYLHSHRGAHAHDIPCLCLVPRPSLPHLPGGKGEGGSLLLSGGEDGKLVLYGGERGGFARCRPFLLPLLSLSPPAPAHSNNLQIVAMHRRERVDVWANHRSKERDGTQLERQGEERGVVGEKGGRRVGRVAQERGESECVANLVQRGEGVEHIEGVQLVDYAPLSPLSPLSSSSPSSPPSPSPLLVVSSPSSLKVYSLSLSYTGGGEVSSLSFSKLYPPFAPSLSAPLPPLPRLSPLLALPAPRGGLSLVAYSPSTEEVVLGQMEREEGALRLTHRLPHRGEKGERSLSLLSSLRQSVRKIIISPLFVGLVSCADVITLYSLTASPLSLSLYGSLRIPNNSSICDASFFSLPEEEKGGLVVLAHGNKAFFYSLSSLSPLSLYEGGGFGEGLGELLKGGERFPLTHVLPLSPTSLPSLLPLSSTPSALPPGKKGGKKNGPPPMPLSAPVSPVSPPCFFFYGPLFALFLDLSSFALFVQKRERKRRAAPSPSAALPPLLPPILRDHPISQIYSLSPSPSSALSSSLSSSQPASLSRKRPLSSAEEEYCGCAVLELYKNVVHVGSLSDHELVVVENPWQRINQHLPDAPYRKRYRT